MRQIIIAVVALAFTIELQAQIITFQKAYNDNMDEIGYAVEEAADGYLYAGLTNSSGQGGNDGYLVKTDAAGNLSWAMTYGGPGDDYFTSIHRSSDNGYILAGFSNSFMGSDSGGVFLVKVDVNGVQQWAKYLGGSYGDMGRCVRQTSDGGYVVCGYSQSFSANGDYDVYVAKTDASGNVQWANTYGGAARDEAYAIKQTSDGGYIVTGATESFGSSEDIYLLKLSSTGALSWSKSYDISYSSTENKQRAYDVIELAGGYLLCGTTFQSMQINIWSPVLIRVGSTGNVMWGKNYNLNTGNSGFRAVQKTGNAYVMGGYMGNTYQQMLMTDTSGNTQWAKVYNLATNGVNDGYGIKTTSDGGFLMTGFTGMNSYTALMAIKAGPGGITGCNETNPSLGGSPSPLTINTSVPSTATMQAGTSVTSPSVTASTTPFVATACSTEGIDEAEKDNIIISPNPSQGMINVSAGQQIDQAFVYDMTGRLLLSTETASDNFSIDLSSFAPGVYYIMLRSQAGKVYSRPVIVQQ
jgi:hypothetical protein